MDEEEIKQLEHMEKIRQAIADAKGLLLPAENQRALGYVTHYYEQSTTRSAKAKAMMDEHFSNLLTNYPDLAIGRAKAMSQGSEFGKKYTFYKNQSEGYREIMQTLKKNIAYYEGAARNQW